MITDGKYYVGRVIKLGAMDKEMLIRAILTPTLIKHGNNAWTFINVKEYNNENKHYIFGYLSKFALSGEISKIDTVSHVKRSAKLVS
jgi:hypothetical protein